MYAKFAEDALQIVASRYWLDTERYGDLMIILASDSFP
jgi:hypothetical protein